MPAPLRKFYPYAVSVRALAAPGEEISAAPALCHRLHTPGAARRAEGVLGAGAAPGPGLRAPARPLPRDTGYEGSDQSEPRVAAGTDEFVCVCVCVCGEESRPARRAPRGQSAAPGRTPPARTCRCQKLEAAALRSRAAAGWDVGLYPFLSHGW